MNTWVVWFFNPNGYPKVQSREIQGDIYSLSSSISGAGIDCNQVFAIHLKGTAPMVPGMLS